MLSSKIRNTAFAVLAASSIALAGAPLTSVASAAPNNHAYAKTVGKRRAWQNTCANAQVTFDNVITLVEYDAERGDIKNAEKDLDLAIAIHDNAKASGCSVS